MNNHGGDGFVTFFYTSVLTSLSPTIGLIGDSLTIDGSGLDGATVAIGGVAATVTSSNDAELVAVVPAQSPLPNGELTVDVATAGGVTLPAVGAFTYAPAPRVTATSPASITRGTAPTVTITGTNFTAATASLRYHAGDVVQRRLRYDHNGNGAVQPPFGTVDTTV